MRAPYTAIATLAALLVSGSASAQWLNQPTPGTPRLPDGKPNLSAPVNRTADGRPDLSGIWSAGTLDYYMDLAARLKPGEVQLTPWAAAVRKQRMDRDHIDDPYAFCLPLGVPRINFRSEFKIVQTPALTLLLYETYVGMMFRQVFTDGRALPKASDSEPTWLGYQWGDGTAIPSWWRRRGCATAAGSARGRRTRTATRSTSRNDSDAETSATWSSRSPSTIQKPS